MTAPIRETCPDINAAQKLLRDLIGWIGNQDPADMRQINKLANQIDDMLEGLRKSNETLRAWGIEKEKAAEAAEEAEQAAQHNADALATEAAAMATDYERLEVLCMAVATLLRMDALPDSTRIEAARKKLAAAGYGRPSETVEIIHEVPTTARLLAASTETERPS